ncbi:MAG: methyl-accepting chemotaxis protein, partial [Pseudomonas sp.]
MRFKSIQFSVALLAGASVLAVVVALVLYSLFAGARTQELVKTSSQSLLEDMIHQRLTSLAQAQVSQVLKELEYPLVIATSLAQTNALGGETDASGAQAMNLTREELLNLLQNALRKNPKLVDAYIGWENNAFDGQDAAYAGQTAKGASDTGRFIPWAYRKDDGSLTLDTLGPDIESDKLLPTGVRAGEYYLCPRDKKVTCLIDPAPYEMGGKMVMLASFNVPILVNGKFQGIVGADLTVDFIQELLNVADSKLYDGAGELGLISDNGRIVAYTKDPSKRGTPSAEVLPGIGDLKALPLNQPSFSSNKDTGQLQLLMPFSIADTGARWTLVLQLPEKAVYAELHKLHTELNEQRQTDTLGMLVVGLLIAGVGLVVIWFVGYGIARPLKQMVLMLDDIAKGDGDLTKRLQVDRADELGQIANGFNTFLNKLQNMIRDVVGSVQKVSDSSENTADIAIRTNEGVQRQMVEIDQVATAVHEMTATAQDVARNAT